MKINVEIDCSPEEARRFLGLPDVDKANSAYVDGMAKFMAGAGSIDQLETYAKQLAPMGQIGLKIFQGLMEGAKQTPTRDDASPQPSSTQKPNE